MYALGALKRAFRFNFTCSGARNDNGTNSGPRTAFRCVRANSSIYYFNNCIGGFNQGFTKYFLGVQPSNEFEAKNKLNCTRWPPMIFTNA